MLAQAAMDPRTKKIPIRKERDLLKVFINRVLTLMFVPEIRSERAFFIKLLWRLGFFHP